MYWVVILSDALPIHLYLPWPISSEYINIFLETNLEIGSAIICMKLNGNYSL